MRKLTKKQIERIIAKHAKYLQGDLKGGARADFSDCDMRDTGVNLTRANLTRANLDGANLVLGSSTFLGSCLQLLGACKESITWVDSQKDISDWSKIIGHRKDWEQWLRERLGGEPTAERLLTVVQFILRSIQ